MQISGASNQNFPEHRKWFKPVRSLLSLIDTANDDMIAPYAFLRFIIETMPISTIPKEHKALLPWNVKMSLI